MDKHVFMFSMMPVLVSVVIVLPTSACPSMLLVYGEVSKRLGMNWFCQLGVFLRDLESGKKAFPLCHLPMEFQVNSGLW